MCPRYKRGQVVLCKFHLTSSSFVTRMFPKPRPRLQRGCFYSNIYNASIYFISFVLCQETDTISPIKTPCIL